MPAPDIQASLAGFGAPHPTDRLFFAVMPPAPVAERIAALAGELRQELGLRGKPRPTGHLHVTLHHLGDFVGVPPDRLDRARAAAGRVRTAPFDARFDRAGSFSGRSGRHPFVVLGAADAGGLAQLHGTLGAQLAAAGLAGRERPFMPHLTLLYDAQSVSVRPVEPVGWRVQEFLLIHSLLGRTEYRVLGRWPLVAHR